MHKFLSNKAKGNSRQTPPKNKNDVFLKIFGLYTLYLRTKYTTSQPMTIPNKKKAVNTKYNIY